MSILTETICIKRWQAYLLLSLAGFAIGNLLAKGVGALGGL